jgi:hypothetical protein
MKNVTLATIALIALSACEPQDLQSAQDAAAGTGAEVTMRDDKVSFCMDPAAYNLTNCSEIRNRPSDGLPMMHCDIAPGGDWISAYQTLDAVSKDKVGYFTNKLGKEQLRLSVVYATTDMSHDTAFADVQDNQSRMWFSINDSSLVSLTTGACTQ